MQVVSEHRKTALDYLGSFNLFTQALSWRGAAGGPHLPSLEGAAGEQRGKVAAFRNKVGPS